MPLDLEPATRSIAFPFDAIGAMATCCSATCRPAAARHPAAVSRVHRHRAAGAAALSAVHEHHVAEQLQGQDPLQLAADHARASFQERLRLLVAYTLSKTEDNVLKQDGSGDEWAIAAGGRHFPHFLKLTWIYEVPIGPGKKIDVDGVLGQIVGGWTITGIHNYRSGSTLSISDPNQRRRLSRSVPMSCQRRGSGHLRRFGGRSRERHAVLEPGRVRDAAVVGAGHSVTDRHGAGDPRRPRDRRPIPRISASSSASAWATGTWSSGSTS